MELLSVYDLTYKKLAILNDGTPGSAKNINAEFSINAIPTLSFDMPLNSDKWQYLINENLVNFRGEFYFIKNPQFTHNSNSEKNVTVSCVHLSNSLSMFLNTDIKEVGKTALELIKLVLGEELVSGEKLISGENEIKSLSGWKAGDVTVDPKKCRALESSEQSIFTNLVSIADKFNGVLQFNSIAKTVDLLDVRTDREIQIRKGKNLTNVNFAYDYSELITRMNVFGGQDPSTGNEISIQDVNPESKSYLEDISFYINQGYTEDYIHNHPELFHREMTWRASEYVDEKALYDDAMDKMSILSKPKIDCTIEGIDLSNFPEYFTASPIIGEVVSIIDEELALNLKAKVTKITFNSEQPYALKIQISNIVEYNSLLKSLIDTSNAVQKVITPGQEIIGQYIKNATIDNAKITSLDAEKIKTGTIDANRITASVIDAINAYVGTAQIKVAKIDDLTADKMKANVIDAINATIDTATIDSAKIPNLDASKIISGDIHADRIKTAIIDAVNARISQLTVDDAVIKTLGANVINAINANMTDAKINSAQIDSIDAGTITVDNLKANVIEALYSSIQTLSANNAKVKQLGADLISALNANFSNAKINTAQIGTLSANNFTAGLITSDMIKTADITIDKLISNGAGLRFTGFIDINKNQTGSDSNGIFAVGGFKKSDGNKIYDSVTNLTMTISGIDYNFTSGKVVTDYINKKSYMLMYTTDKARFASITGINGTCSNIFAVYRKGTQWYADNGSVGSDGTNGVTFTFNSSTDFIIGTFLFNSSGSIYNWSPMVNAQTLMTGDYFKTGSIDANVIKTGSIKATDGLFDKTTVFDETAIKISAKAITTGELDANNVTIKNLKADSIVAGALTIDGDNLIHNSEWLVDVGTWTIDYPWILDSVFKYDTSNTMKYSISGASSDSSRSIYSEFVKTSSNQNFVASLYAYSDDITLIDGTNPTTNLYMEFYGDSGGRIGTSSTTNIKPSLSNTWQRFMVTGKTPEGTTRVRLRAYVRRNGSLWIARPMIQRGSVASEWKAHTDEKISDGAIDNDKIADNTITGDKLIVDSITSRELKSEAIKTKMMEADTANFVSSKINNLTVDQFEGKSISADKIIVGDVGKSIYEYVSYVSKAQTINNTTDTLFHYDSNLCATNGLNPETGYVATILENEGKYGGAVGIYESTINSATTQSLTSYAGAEYTVEDYPLLGTGWKKVKVTKSGSNANGHAAYLSGLSVGVGVTFTYSIEFISESGNIAPWIDGTSGIGAMYKIGKYRYARTYTNDTGTAKTEAIYFKYKPATISTVIDETFYYRFHQIEAKSFPTAYIIGTKPYGVISYGPPSNILPITQHSVFMWVNSDQVYNTGSWKMAFSVSPAFYIGWNNGVYTVSLVNSSGLQKSFSDNLVSFSPNTWYFIGYTFDNGKVSMYINGKQVGTTQTTSNTISYGKTASEISSAKIKIGTYFNGTYALNGLVDEVFISKNVLSPTDILAMYNLQQPLYDPDPIVKPPSPLTVTMTIQ